MRTVNIPVSGDCPLCGKATYKTTGLTAAESPNGPAVITQVLIKYKGQYICKSCKRVLILRDESMQIGAKWRKQQDFLSNAGIVTVYEE